ncbi:GntR family transcriptional regulator, partial [Bacillus pumilus]
MIIDDIKSKIFTWDYRIGERIPTESSLQEMYQVSRHTV